MFPPGSWTYKGPGKESEEFVRARGGVGRETHVSDEEVESCEAREELSFAG